MNEARAENLRWMAQRATRLEPTPGVVQLVADAADELAEEVLRLRRELAAVAEGPGMLRVRDEVRRVLDGPGTAAA